METVADAQQLPGEAVAKLRQIKDYHNNNIHYSSKWRVGEWDFLLTNYSLEEAVELLETDPCKTLTVKGDQVFKCPLATSL